MLAWIGKPKGGICLGGGRVIRTAVFGFLEIHWLKGRRRVGAVIPILRTVPGTAFRMERKRRWPAAGRAGIGWRAWAGPVMVIFLPVRGKF